MYEKEILDVYRYCGVRSFPIDCDDIINKLGYRIVTYQSVANGNRELLIKLMSVSNDGFVVRRTRTIYINANTDRRRQRFTKCHELGHIVLLTTDEVEADAFAAALLAPMPIVRRYVPVDADDVCRLFDVSVAAANRIVADFKKYDFTRPEAKDVFDYFMQFQKKERKKETRKTKKIWHEDFPDNWNEMMLRKHDWELYFYRE